MTAHIDAHLNDYLLDLLPDRERRGLEQHAAECARCMRLLAEERAYEARLTAAFRQGASAPAGSLEALWPGVAAAISDPMAQPLSRPRLLWWYQWRAALATMAVALVVLTGLFSGAQKLDGWLLDSHTPTVAVRTAMPTASMTPTVSQTPDELASNKAAQSFFLVDQPEIRIWGTPEPELNHPIRQPSSNHPAASPTAGP